MLNIDFGQIFDGITLALHAAFPAAKVHGGNVEQGLAAGDFNVIPVGVQHTGEMGGRCLREITLDVVYYPTRTGGRMECLEIAGKLPGVLSTVRLANGTQVHGSGFTATVEEDALHMTAAYRHHGYTAPDNALMETLAIDT